MATGSFEADNVHRRAACDTPFSCSQLSLHSQFQRHRQRVSSTSEAFSVSSGSICTTAVAASFGVGRSSICTARAAVCTFQHRTTSRLSNNPSTWQLSSRAGTAVAAASAAALSSATGERLVWCDIVHDGHDVDDGGVALKCSSMV